MAFAPVAIVPRLQVIVFALTEQVPNVVVIGDWQLARLQYALLTWRAGGSGSVKTTLWAVAGPLLVTTLE